MATDVPRSFTAADQRDAVAMLVRSFFDDPAFVYVFPDPATRAARMHWLGERWVRARAISDDLSVIDGGAVEALLVGVRPGGHADLSFWTQIKVGLLAMPLAVGAGSFRRFLQVDADMKKRHAEELDAPHFVIDILAVDPPCQGKGRGTLLVRAYLEGIDRAKMPAYLITTRDRNVPFYQRFGFEVIRAAPIAPGGPLGWSMRRPSRTL